ncbi:MAG: four helix bundle suffix domain-containing protein [Sedimentisphaeraceae bacterium JB056]
MSIKIKTQKQSRTHIAQKSHKSHSIHKKFSQTAVFVRKLASQKDSNSDSFRTFFETRKGEIVANIAICLIYQTKYLLGKQIEQLEADFLKHGGIRERMTAARIAARNKKKHNHRPICPKSLISPMNITIRE